MIDSLRAWALLFIIMLAAGVTQAEQKRVFDGPDGSEYEVHYNAFTSTFLEADIAKQYDLIRSKALGVLNVSVIRRNADGSRKAVGSVVQATQTNELQQQQNLSFKQVVEGEAIYYLAQFQFAEGKYLRFDLTLYPEGSTDPLKLRFNQALYN